MMTVGLGPRNDGLLARRNGGKVEGPCASLHVEWEVGSGKEKTVEEASMGT